MIEKYPVRRTHDTFSIASGIPSNTNAWLKIVLVCVDSFLQTQLVICSLREIVRLGQLRRKFDVIPQSKIQCQIRAQSPGVLYEKTKRFIAEAVLRVADALHQRARDTKTERLNWRKLWNACREAEL